MFSVIGEPLEESATPNDRVTDNINTDADK
jgi:hypothetical protein